MIKDIFLYIIFKLGGYIFWLIWYNRLYKYYCLLRAYYCALWKYIQVGSIINLFEFVINVMQRHLLCFPALCQVGAVGCEGRNVSSVGGWI